MKYRVVPDTFYLGGNHGTEGNVMTFKVEKRDWFGWYFVTFCETREGGWKIINHLTGG